MNRPRIVTNDVAEAVERFAEDSLEKAARFTNVQPYDDSNVYELHLLAAYIFSAGYEAGERAAEVRHRGSHAREFNARKRAESEAQLASVAAAALVSPNTDGGRL